MVRLAVAGEEGFELSDIELLRPPPSYTVDTLARLAAAHPADELLLILGPDALADLPTWREPATILARAEIIAVTREGVDDVRAIVAAPQLAALLGPEKARLIVENRVTCPAIGIRASDLRAAIRAGQSIRYRTPRAVEQYINAHGLYQ